MKGTRHTSKLFKISLIMTFAVFMFAAYVTPYLSQNETLVLAATGNDAQMYINTIPTTMIAGKSYTVSITALNTGSTTWTDENGYVLSAVGGFNFFTGDNHWLRSWDSIAPWQSKTFSFDMIAPSTVGTYTAEWIMKQGSSGFGQILPIKVNVAAVPENLSVKIFGAKGDGINDDTIAIQNTINAAYSLGIKKIVIPDGNYMINASKSIRPKSGQTLLLSESTTLQAIPNDSGSYYVVKLSNVSNVSIIGGNIKGERSKHSGTSGQWGMVIGVLSCNNINISNVNISDGWGDGIYLGVMPSYQDYNSNITIENVKSDNNRRAGLSIISVKGLTVRDSIFCNNNGHNPMSGINLEPNSTTDLLQDILIENVTCYNNGVAADQVNGWGLDMWLRAGTSSMYGLPKANVSVDVVNLTAYGNYRGDISPNITRSYIPAGYDIAIM